TMMSIDGGSPGLSDAIRQMLAVPFPISSFDLNLDQMRNQIQTLDAVASADLRVGTGGVLQVTIHARKPVVVWRTRDALLLLDATGHRVAGLAARDARADLPLIAGAGAEDAVPQAMQILAAAAPLQSRIRGLVRVGARRWDLVLDRDQRIMLPEKAPVQALERVIALNDAQDLLSRDVTVVDMRLANRPTLRLTPAAFAARQQALGLDQGAKKSR
ncbi:cell division protein FtsQ, partial [Thioclava sp. BHET1]